MSETIYALGGKPYRRDGEDLWEARTGTYLGRFFGEEVYSPGGTYLGELTSSGRLGTKTSKKGKTRGSFGYRGDRGGVGLGTAGQAGFPGGFEDFAP